MKNTEILLTIKLQQALFIDPKRVRLLKEIQQCGSINQAAKNAKVSQQVKTVAVFPADSHKPVVYPVSIVRGHDNADSRDFLKYLESDAAKKVLVGYGFYAK